MNISNSKPTTSARFRRMGLFRLSMPQFLASLVLLLVATPFVEDLKSGEVIESVLMTLVLVLGVMAVGKNRRTLVIATLLVGPTLTGKWLNHLWPEQVRVEFYLPLALLFMAFLLWKLIRFTLVAPRVNLDVLCAGLAMYLLLGMAWAFGYVLVARFNPGAFTLPAGNQMLSVTSFYFSFITLSTVGFGDIVPVSHVARMLAAAEAITGTLFMAVFIARLVALYTTQVPADDQFKTPPTPML